MLWLYIYPPSHYLIILNPFLTPLDEKQRLKSPLAFGRETGSECKKVEGKQESMELRRGKKARKSETRGNAHLPEIARNEAYRSGPLKVDKK